jgi:hypothetical protein
MQAIICNSKLIELPYTSWVLISYLRQFILCLVPIKNHGLIYPVWEFIQTNRL